MFKRKTQKRFCPYCGSELKREERDTGFSTKDGKPLPKETYWVCTGKKDWMCLNLPSIDVSNRP